ncbi:cobalt-precorrin-6A reductase [Afifella sp. IM 167]|uniref:cobalt-precorrin-6A reductase n=1 Tax=Afifella sp. IM 167 TaxID=2033586 RepID=UPI001CCC785E|nr:cobalt-precorrin-6A reductase [Afifella sp. IM 167]MBZ8134970.1 cobalt-precorrin-6A reductase [Afifella sp. IM 167]
MPKVMILGGTAEAGELAARLAGDARLDTVTSLAGLTRLPNVSGHVRRGGFGGPDGLAQTLSTEGYDALIDATHPFAGQIARHAAEAAERAGVPRIKLVRPGFERLPGDHFIEVADMTEAAAAIPEGARVFLAAGRREARAFAGRKDLWCLVRMIEPPVAGEEMPRGEVILGRPPTDPEKEMALLAEHRIEWIVSKDSGGRASAKIEAARRLKIPVVLVRRPAPPSGPQAAQLEAILAWLEETLFPAP